MALPFHIYSYNNRYPWDTGLGKMYVFKLFKASIQKLMFDYKNEQISQQVKAFEKLNQKQKEQANIIAMTQFELYGNNERISPDEVLKIAKTRKTVAEYYNEEIAKINNLKFEKYLKKIKAS